MTQGTEVFVPEPVEVGSGWRDMGSSDRISTFVSEGKEMRAMAEHIASSGAYRHKSATTVLTIMLAAYEMNIPITTALASMYPVKGKLAMEGALMSGLAVSRCGVRWDVVESSEDRCALRFRRAGWDDMDVEYTVEHAAKAGLLRKNSDGSFTSTKDNWTKHREEMLWWRCISRGLKRIAPDFFSGIYAVGELHSFMEEQATSEAARDLDALKRGIDPHPDLMTLDEIDQYTAEIERAVKEGHFTKAEAKALKALMVAGEWTEAREALESLRMKILGASEQPGLDL